MILEERLIELHALARGDIAKGSPPFYEQKDRYFNALDPEGKPTLLDCLSEVPSMLEIEYFSAAAATWPL